MGEADVLKGSKLVDNSKYIILMPIITLRFN
jgi:hypothetical protein